MNIIYAPLSTLSSLVCTVSLFYPSFFPSFFPSHLPILLPTPPLPSSRPPSVLQNIQCGFYACVILMYVIGPGSHISFSSKLLFKQAPCFQDPSMLFVFIHLPHCRNSMEGVHTFTQRPPSVWTLRGYQVPDTAKNTASHILVCVHLWVCKNFFGMYNQERDGGVIGCVYT